jgi:hypothetical protein
MSTHYKTYCRYARIAARLENGTASVQLVLKEVGSCGLAAIQAYIAAGKPDFYEWQAF